MQDDFRSIYSKHLTEFIALKKSLGYKYKTGTQLLKQLDALAEKCGEATPGLTKEFAEKWSLQSPHEKETYKYTKCLTFLSFSSYLRDLGIQSYLPRLPRYPGYNFKPYIFSDKEIAAIFKASDNLKLAQFKGNTGLICMPALLRTLYSTGIRIGEILAIKRNDVNLIDGYILIRDSKNAKERIIPISKSLIDVLNTYEKYRSQVPLHGTSDFFFAKLNGQKCSRSLVFHWFRKCLEIAKIPYLGGHRGPRIHDLRHTFAVNSLAGMAENGIDLYASMPILSTYLGHTHFQSTEHYVRLTATMYPHILTKIETHLYEILPKLNSRHAD